MIFGETLQMTPDVTPHSLNYFQTFGASLQTGSSASKPKGRTAYKQSLCHPEGSRGVDDKNHIHTFQSTSITQTLQLQRGTEGLLISLQTPYGRAIGSLVKTGPMQHFQFTHH